MSVRDSQNLPPDDKIRTKRLVMMAYRDFNKERLMSCECESNQ